MSKFAYNLSLIFKNKRSLTVSIIVFVIIILILFDITDYKLLRWNIGPLYTNIWIAIDMIFALLFAVFLGSFVYKMLLFGKSKNIWWWLGWFLSVLVTWCTSCTLTLASYIGLGSLIALLPFWGIELKILWLILVIYGVYDSVSHLTECKVKNSLL